MCQCDDLTTLKYHAHKLLTTILSLTNYCQEVFRPRLKFPGVGHAHPDFFQGGRLPTLLPPCRRPCSTVSMTLLRSHSTLIRSFHVSALGTTRNLTVLSNSKCTNTLEHARNSRGKPLYAGLVFQSIPCAQTEILEPLVCDPEQEKIHRANLDRIKAFLTSLKPSDQSLTMNDFLTL